MNRSHRIGALLRAVARVQDDLLTVSIDFANSLEDGTDARDPDVQGRARAARQATQKLRALRLTGRAWGCYPPRGALP